MSTRTAVIVIGVFCLGAVVFGGWVMGGAGVEFAVVGLVILLGVGIGATVVPALGRKNGGKKGDGGASGG